MTEKKKNRSLESISDKTKRSWKSSVGHWITDPTKYKRWVLVQTGMILKRLGDMLLNEPYNDVEDYKRDLREFQDWSATFADLLVGFHEQKEKLMPDDDDEETEAEGSPPKTLPWNRPGRGQG